MASRAEFRVFELITLADYPPAERWGAFYGQSTSLVQYLVAQGGAARFLEFVELSLEKGYEAALNRVYRFGIAELERHWKADVKVSSTAVAGANSPSASALAPLPTAAAIPAQVVSLKTSHRQAVQLER
ncbi:MAG: hypothetical protein HY288_19970 [Planctomycetia bacterium]|nr:hypothetical protein [Planctomycetia bacterium]